MGVQANQFVTGANERVLTDDGQPGMRGKAGIGSLTEQYQGQVAAAIYANCAHLDNQQLDEIIEWVRLYGRAQWSSKALTKLRIAMVPLRSAYTDEARLDALHRVHGMLFMLQGINMVDEPTIQAMLQEIQDADLSGKKRCDERKSSGKVTRCMEREIHARAMALMSLEEALQAVRTARTKEEVASSSFEVEKLLLESYPVNVDDEEMIEWRVFIHFAVSQRLEELARKSDLTHE